ncbi:MAG: GNAT family N-acetyltransferase [Lachnospiraceae bacterium]|nr:GNAT family N-acetyltransferase [Lachnospiraceae bacterium]
MLRLEKVNGKNVWEILKLKVSDEQRSFVANNDLYRYASDPDVGVIAGWPPHQSRDVIKNVFNGKEVYAIYLKEDGKAIGAIELKLNGHTDMTDRDDECELGYWLGKPFWGQGIMPEAVKEMLRHGFEDCGMQKVVLKTDHKAWI